MAHKCTRRITLFLIAYEMAHKYYARSLRQFKPRNGGAIVTPFQITSENMAHKYALPMSAYNWHINVPLVLAYYARVYIPSY